MMNKNYQNIIMMIKDVFQRIEDEWIIKIYFKIIKRIIIILIIIQLYKKIEWNYFEYKWKEVFLVLFILEIIQWLNK